MTGYSESGVEGLVKKLGKWNVFVCMHICHMYLFIYMCVCVCVLIICLHTKKKIRTWLQHKENKMHDSAHIHTHTQTHTDTTLLP